MGAEVKYSEASGGVFHSRGIRQISMHTHRALSMDIFLIARGNKERQTETGDRMKSSVSGFLSERRKYMTLNQLLYVVEVSKTKSINATAHTLFRCGKTQQCLWK